MTDMKDNPMAPVLFLPLIGHDLADRRAALTAFAAAHRLGGSVAALSLMPPVDIFRAAHGQTLPASLAQMLVERATEDQRQQEADNRALFEECRARWPDLPAGWDQAVGSVVDIAVEEARLSDLAVIAPEPDAPDKLLGLIEGVLFQSGRAALLAAAEPGDSLGAKVMVAWDDSAAAARAVAAALPLLRRADGVDIVSAEDPEAKRAGSPDRLAAYLARHAITAQSHILAPGRHRSVADALLNTAQERGADLMVMGGYGHNRYREMVLGGVTKDILHRQPPLAILMAH